MQAWHTPEIIDLGSVAEAQANVGTGTDLTLLAS